MSDNENWCVECGVVWVERKGDKCQRCRDRARAEQVLVEAENWKEQRRKEYQHHDHKKREAE